ncbi:MAG TPA: CVNH domain-containing protein [Burkholderiales bacterium]|jgi:hypothetical protein|nr:CVNH domain-containing protein [Burkholderiales bacterium]
MVERFSKYLRFAAALAFVCTLFASGSAQAQVPGGSYMRSCEGAHMNGDVLEARCQTMSGHMRRAYLPRAFNCRGGVENIDGSLRCAAFREPPRARLPEGSYQASCSHIRMRDDTLVASCQTRRGHWVESALHRPYRCRGIDNMDGNLVCR